jgi:DNA-binding transcriptional MocR family regulator
VFELDRASSLPLVEQVVERMGSLIQRGQLAEGARLPSIRKLSQLVGASAFTIVDAYDRLVARGLIESRAGRGFFVVRRPAFAALATIEVSAETRSDAVALTRLMLSSSKAVIAAGSGHLPPGWLMEDVATSMLARLTQSRRPEAWLPCPPQGLPALREQLAVRLVQRGIAASPAHIVTTFGATQAFDLIARALLSPGDAVLVEDPGFFVLFSQLRGHHVRLIPVPRRADGPDLAALEAACRAHRPRAYFLQTVLQNPTGYTMPAASGHRILSLAETYGFAIVEDDVYGDLHEGPAVRLAQLDGLRHVIYVSSFTKLVGPTVRTGFVAAQAALVEQLIERKVLSVLSHSALLESVVLAVLESGRYPKHLLEVRTRLARARHDARIVLERAGITFDDGGGGVFLWGRIPDRVDADALVQRARAESILLARGALFSPEGACRQWLRFNAAHSAAPELERFLHAALAA